MMNLKATQRGIDPGARNVCWYVALRRDRVRRNGDWQPMRPITDSTTVVTSGVLQSKGN